MSFQISKIFTADIGHRVWTQELDKNLSCGAENKCRFIHGHSIEVTVGLKSEYLKNNMVLDFNNLSFVKQFIDDFLDHKFLIDINDPLLDYWLPFHRDAVYSELFVSYKDGFSVINFESDIFRLSATQSLQLDSTLEFLKSLVFLPFVPTSENLSKWLFEIIRVKLGEYGDFLDYVKFKETNKTGCIFSNES